MYSSQNYKIIALYHNDDFISSSSTAATAGAVVGGGGSVAADAAAADPVQLLCDTIKVKVHTFTTDEVMKQTRLTDRVRTDRLNQKCVER